MRPARQFLIQEIETPHRTEACLSVIPDASSAATTASIIGSLLIRLYPDIGLSSRISAPVEGRSLRAVMVLAILTPSYKLSPSPLSIAPISPDALGFIEALSIKPSIDIQNVLPYLS